MQVIIALLVTFVIFCPILVDLYVVYDNSSKRINFAAYAYGLIKIFSCYAERLDKGIVIHYSTKKARIMERSDFKKSKFKITDLSSIELYKVATVFSFGFSAQGVGYGAYVSGASKIAYPILKTRKPFLKIHDKILIGRTEDTYVYSGAKVGFNLFALIILLVKILVRK